MNYDEKVITAIRSGNDEKTIKLLYKKSLPPIIQMIRNFGGNKDDANDIFQDAVVILIRNIKRNSFDQKSNINGFLYTISKNLWINKVKRDSKTSSIEELELENDLNYEIQHNASIKEKENTIKDIISKLDPKCAHVLHAILFTDKGYSEIAEEIGLANANVMKVTKSRCKDKLIELLKNDTNLRQILINYNERFSKHI